MNTYTPNQLLEEFRRRRYLEPVRNDCVIERTDGADIDTLLKAEIEQWYATLLDTAPPCWLATENVADETTMENLSGTGSMLLRLPENVRRVVSITIDGNPAPVTIITDPDSPLMKLQSNPFTRGGKMHPVAFLHSPCLITLYAHDKQGNPPSLACLTAIRHNPDIYQFDNRAWETVPQIKI